MNPRDLQILRIAWPSIVSNITVPLLGLIDVAITGHLGNAAYIGAIAVGGMLFNIIYWTFAFLRMGTSGMTAQALGARRLDEASHHLLRSCLIALSISVLLLLLQVPVCDVALGLIAPEAEVAGYARTYFNICIWGAPPSLLLFTMSGWYVGMQNTRIPMLVAIVQNVANIVFSLVLVYLLGMKIEGVALGTVLAQYTGLAVALVMLARYYVPRLQRYVEWGSVLTRQALLRFFMVNKDIFLRTLCLIFVHFFFIAAGARFGSKVLAVNALLMQLFTLYSYFMDGFAYAGEALVGKAIGARNRGMYHETIRRLFFWGTLMVLMFTLVYALLGHPFLGLLTNEQTVLDEAQHYWAWMLLFPLCGMAPFIWDGIFIGATQTKSMLISVGGGMLTFIAMYYLSVPFLGAHGLWLAFVSYLGVRGLIASACQYYSSHHQPLP